MSEFINLPENIIPNLNQGQKTEVMLRNRKKLEGCGKIMVVVFIASLVANAILLPRVLFSSKDKQFPSYSNAQIENMKPCETNWTPKQGRVMLTSIEEPGIINSPNLPDEWYAELILAPTDRTPACLFVEPMNIASEIQTFHDVTVTFNSGLSVQLYNPRGGFKQGLPLPVPSLIDNT